MNEQFELVVPIVKRDLEKQLIYGCPLIPDQPDSQGDTISANEIERAAHNWLAQGFTSNTGMLDWQHESVLPIAKVHPVESYLAPAAFELGGVTIRKGSWIVVSHVVDGDLWELVKSGEAIAYSIKGSGNRTEV